MAATDFRGPKRIIAPLDKNLYKKTPGVSVVQLKSFRVPEGLNTQKGGEVVSEKDGLVSVFARKMTAKDGPGNYGKGFRQFISPSGMNGKTLLRYDAAKNLWYAPVSQATRDILIKRHLESFGCGACGSKFTVQYL